MLDAHLTFNMFVLSADKLYKKNWSREWSGILRGLIWIHTGWYSLIIFRNSLVIDQTERYTPTVINLFDLVTATSVVMPKEYFLEYSSD